MIAKSINNKIDQNAICTFIVILLLIMGCADPPPTKPEVTGSIYIDSEITTGSNNTFKPEIIGVVLDGDSLGQFSNPAVINGVLTGQHLLDVYADNNGVIYRCQARHLVVTFNSTLNVSVHLMDTGVLVINGLINGNAVDTVRLILDGIDLGREVCPRWISSISSGRHDIKVMSSLDTLFFEGWIDDLEIVAAETIEVNIDLANVLPFVNNRAPDITSLDADGNVRSLFEHWGEVIFLYFFRST